MKYYQKHHAKKAAKELIFATFPGVEDLYMTAFSFTCSTICVFLFWANILLQFKPMLVKLVLSALMLYSVIVFMYYTVDYWKKYRKEMKFLLSLHLD